jgi:hypothetical protein
VALGIEGSIKRLKGSLINKGWGRSVGKEPVTIVYNF